MRSVEIMDGQYTLYDDGTICRTKSKRFKKIERYTAYSRISKEEYTYAMVSLWDSNAKRLERKSVPKLVAEHFIPNPNGYYKLAKKYGVTPTVIRHHVKKGAH